jgi:hypothetical protein
VNVILIRSHRVSSFRGLPPLPLCGTVIDFGWRKAADGGVVRINPSRVAKMLIVRKRGWLLLVAAAVAFASPVSPAQSQQGLPGFIEPQPVAIPVPVPYSANFSLSPNFVVDGLALGGEVYPDSAIYKSYACRQSDDFAGFTWCRVHHTKMSKFGRYTSWVTILHSGANRNLVGIVTSKLNFFSEIKNAGDIPQNVNFALKASVAANFLQDNNIKFQIGETTQAMKAPDLADEAKAFSVYIECH